MEDEFYPGQLVIHYTDMTTGVLIEQQTKKRGIDYWESVSWAVWTVLTESNQLEVWSESSIFPYAPPDV